jgi:hydroxylamine reductase (hybrid-cluster protein)
MDAVPEIRREKVYLQPGMSTEEVKKKYGLTSDQAYAARMKGFFVKNYSKKQIVIDRENFNSAVVYPLAKTVFARNFKRNPLAQSLYDDMVQEAVTRLFELSGKTKEMANEKYSENYANFWIAHNAMLAFLKTWVGRTSGVCRLKMRPVPFCKVGREPGVRNGDGCMFEI